MTYIVARELVGTGPITVKRMPAGYWRELGRRLGEALRKAIERD